MLIGCYERFFSRGRRPWDVCRRGGKAGREGEREGSREKRYLPRAVHGVSTLSLIIPHSSLILPLSSFLIPPSSSFILPPPSFLPSYLLDGFLLRQLRDKEYVIHRLFKGVNRLFILQQLRDKVYVYQSLSVSVSQSLSLSVSYFSEFNLNSYIPSVYFIRRVRTRVLVLT